MLNTEEFLLTTTDESLDEFLDPCPPGDYLFIAGKPSVATFTYKKGERVGETGYQLVIRWDCQDQGVLAQLDRDKVTVRHSMLLDVTPDGEGLDMGKGKNVGLGQLRAALGQNTPGQTWSPNMIEGQPAILNIKAGVYNDRPTAEVAAVKAPE
jgi:hypothetical protein